MKKNTILNIKNNGFNVPKDYFNNLESTILNQIKIEEMSSKTTGFKVPDNYFDTLENRIIKKTSKKDSSKVIALFSKSNLIYISGIAAAILLLFNLSVFEKAVTFDSIDIETAENYIIDENISSYEIASLLNDDEFLEDNFIEYNLNEETVETYLLNNIDIDDLILE